MRKTDAPIRVIAEFDPEARVWVADSDDVPGLVAEHSDYATLGDMIAELVPLLLLENDLLDDDDALAVPIEIIGHAQTRRDARIPA
ncbi:MAG: DUF1902 domain-containing protein [Sphingomonas sp.]|nr:DUF1902 domain-containing protein [Sphingomonas sp.]